MLFAALSHGELAAYSYLNHKLEDLVTCLQNARYLLMNAAKGGSNRYAHEPLNVMADETLHCESELISLMHAGCETIFTKPIIQQRHNLPLNRYTSLTSVALYCEHVYVEKYMQLISDRYISPDIKKLLKQHISMLTSALTRIKTFVSNSEE